MKQKYSMFRNNISLESLIVDIFSRVIKNIHPLLSISKELEYRQNRGKMVRNKGKKKVVPQLFESPNVIDIVSSDGEDDVAVPNMTPSPTATKIVEQKFCENCEKCICRSWSALVTPEISAFMQTLVISLIGKSDPKIALLNRNEFMIELCPKTDVFISSSNKNWAVSKANGKHRVLVTRILSCLVENDTLLKYNTAEGFHRAYNPKIKKAIIHFIKEEMGITVRDTEYTDIVNKYMQGLRKSKSYSVSASTSTATPNEAVRDKMLLGISQSGNKNGNNNKRKLDKTINKCHDDEKENSSNKRSKLMTSDVQINKNINNPTTSENGENTVEKIKEIPTQPSVNTNDIIVLPEQDS